MKIYLLKCQSCGVALGNNVQKCPYCFQLNDQRALVTDSEIEVTDDKMVIKKKGHLHIGKSSRPQKRDCPYCGYQINTAKRRCGACSNIVLIEALHVSKSLVIEGSLTIENGGQLVIGGPQRQDLVLKDQINSADLRGVKAAIADGANMNYHFTEGSSIDLAVQQGHVEIARYLLGLGVGFRWQGLMKQAQKNGSNAMIEMLKNFKIT